MKNKYLIVVLLVIFFSSFNVLNAQFTDDMEYPAGIPTSSDWWDCTVGCPIIAGPNAGYNSDYAGYIPGDGITDVILDLNNKVYEAWVFSFYMYIPSNKEAYFNLQGVVPVTVGESIVGDFIFNPSLTTPGQGFIDAGTPNPSDDTYFNFPHDEWFRVLMGFDMNSGIATAVWGMYIDGVEVVTPGTPFKDGNGNSPTSLGGVNFYSISADNEYYMDDFYFNLGIILSFEENTLADFSVYPNPTKDRLNIVCNDEIEEIRVFDLNGRRVIEGFSENIVDVSELSPGLYFIELNTINGRSIKKFMKE